MRLAALFAAVAPPWTRFRLDALTVTGEYIVVDLSSTARTACCPDCQRRSHRAHNRFQRVLADLPLSQTPVCVRLHARRFRCVNPACPRQIFRERPSDLAPHYLRRTPALRRQLEAVSFAVGGQAGRRLARQLRLGTCGTSRNTLLRLIRRANLPSAIEDAPELRVLGVDDLAFRRGLRYGALLVDLEQRRVIDLLLDREAATFAAWLNQQQDGKRLEVVSRDRGGACAEGARQGAPGVVQVANRFHLVRNLGQALDRLLIREHRVLTSVAEALWQSSDSSARCMAALALTCCVGGFSTTPPDWRLMWPRTIFTSTLTDMELLAHLRIQNLVHGRLQQTAHLAVSSKQALQRFAV